MADLKVSTTVDGVKREVTVDFERPADYTAAVERWNEPAVHECFIDRLDVKVQDLIRRDVLQSDTYNPETAQADAQAVATGFDLTAKHTRQAKMPAVDKYIEYLQERVNAGTASDQERAMLKAARK